MLDYAGVRGVSSLVIQVATEILIGNCVEKLLLLMHGVISNAG